MTELDTGATAWMLISASLVLLMTPALAYSGILTAIIGSALGRTLGWRVAAEEELAGVDLSQHGESAYDHIPALLTKEN